MSASAARAAPASGEAVATFLRENPGWLAEHPELYLLLAPPVRVHGEGLADHMAAMVREARARAARMAEQAHGVLAAGRAAAGLAARIYEAVLALMRAPDPAECVAADFPALLAIDAAMLCMEADRPRMRTVPAGTVAALLGGRDVVFRDAPADAALLHAEAAPLAVHDALVRVGGNHAPALLALAARERCALDPGHGAGALAFLGRAVATALER
jgi:uncharacterized protein YigA (DUF484 family)